MFPIPPGPTRPNVGGNINGREGQGVQPVPAGPQEASIYNAKHVASPVMSMGIYSKKPLHHGYALASGLWYIPVVSDKSTREKTYH